MMQRLKEDRNQHYNDLKCPCWTSPKAMARFKEQPQLCGNPKCLGCRSPRYVAKGDERFTIQERRWNCAV